MLQAVLPGEFNSGELGGDLGQRDQRDQWGVSLGVDSKQVAVAQKTGVPKWLGLVSGNMDQKLRLAPPGESLSRAQVNMLVLGVSC